MPSIQKMVESAKKSQTERENNMRRVLLIIRSGDVSRQFLQSLVDLVSHKKKYILKIHTSNNGDIHVETLKSMCYDDIDMVISVQPYVGFSVESIQALVSDFESKD